MLGNHLKSTLHDEDDNQEEGRAAFFLRAGAGRGGAKAQISRAGRGEVKRILVNGDPSKKCICLIGPVAVMTHSALRFQAFLQGKAGH